jgi:cellulose synthase/poly-beta-1,6-N-acetylglucosamine synthase-like glycosyltransferase
MIIFAAVEWALAAPAILALLIFTAECGLGLFPAREQSLTRAPEGKVVVLVPAHNEELGIARTVQSLNEDLPANATLLVVADNCTDATAERAAGAGANVIIRHDPDRRSKAFALEFGREHLRAYGVDERPDVVIVVDADCIAEAGTLYVLMQSALLFDAPVQTAYLLQPRFDSPIVQVSNFAFFVKNWVRQKGLARMGAPAVLNGTGMAFPWKQFDAADLASTGLAEDLDLGVASARAGIPPRFTTLGTIWSAPASEQAAATQKARWESGFIQSAYRKSLPILLAGVRRGNFKLAWLGLHLLVPPLTLLLIISSAILVTVAALSFISGYVVPAYVLLSAMTLAGAMVFCAWFRGGRDYLTARSAFRLPAYLIWKAILYGRMLVKPERSWIRTDR